MSYQNITYFSPALGKQSNMLVYIPDDLSLAPFKVVYQLHGYSDDSTMWFWRSNITRYADERGLMIVCPDGGKGFYTDSAENDEYYESHILDTVDYVDKVFNTSKKREDRFIGGLSMGGYGAMKIGLKHTDLFDSVGAHSAVMDIQDFKLINNADPSFMKRYKTIFGDKVKDEDDLFWLVKEYGSKIRIYFDCGKDDFLFKENEKIHNFMVENKIEHVYNVFPGVHSWDYWDEHVKTALDFHLKK